MVLSSVNQPERATSRPALAVPGTGFSCAAIRAGVPEEPRRTECVDVRKLVSRRTRLAQTLAAGKALRSTFNELSMQSDVCRTPGLRKLWVNRCNPESNLVAAETNEGNHGHLGGC